VRRRQQSSRWVKLLGAEAVVETSGEIRGFQRDRESALHLCDPRLSLLRPIP